MSCFVPCWAQLFALATLKSSQVGLPTFTTTMSLLQHSEAFVPSHPSGTGQWWEELCFWDSFSPSWWDTPRALPVMHMGAKEQMSILPPWSSQRRCPVSWKLT